MKILMCYDDIADSKQAAELIAKGGEGANEVEELLDKQLTDQIQGLFKRVEEHVGSGDPTETEKLHFDKDWDLIVIDDNLTRLENMIPRVTAESLIDYIRAFTNIPYAVSLNRSQSDFDLRFLLGDHETKADLALRSTHLEINALWDRRKSVSQDFLPWYWAELRSAPERRKNQIEFLCTRLDEPAFENLGIGVHTESFEFLSAHGKSSLVPDKALQEAEGLESLTFSDVFRAGGRSLLRAEREVLHKNASAGNKEARLAIARTLAAQIDYWFRRDVVGPQDVLVDVPHLLARMPFLLGNKAGDIEAWNETIQAGKPTYGMASDLYEKYIAAAKFDDKSNDRWFQFPVFHWPRLKNNDELNELFVDGAQSGAWADAVFCEDTSRFEEWNAEGSAESVVEFATDLEGPWARRHIMQIDGYEYSPRTRLAL